MPAQDFTVEFERTAPNAQLLRRVELLALTYGVTPLAAAVRLARLQVVDRDVINAVIEAIRRRGEGAERAGGGDWYRSKIGALGPAFVQLVFTALDYQAVSYPVASALLGTKVNHFDTLRERVVRRAAG